MSEHNPAAVLVRECPACFLLWPEGADRHPQSQGHLRALRDAYLAARARVAEVVAAVDAAVVDGYHADTCGTVLSPFETYPCSCWQGDLRAALASFRETP